MLSMRFPTFVHSSHMVYYFLQKVTLDPEVLFTKQERIGKGSFGEVYKGIDNRSSEVLSVNNMAVASFICYVS